MLKHAKNILFDVFNTKRKGLTMASDDLVTVSVPRKHLAKVYGFIASLESDEPLMNSREAATNDSAASDEWTPSRIRKMLQQSPPAMKDILRAMATSPNEWLTTQGLAEAIQGNQDADWKTVAGTMGAFGRRLKNRYGLETFPFEKRYDHDAKSKAYRMSGEVSQLVLQALSEC
jgi:hypothetical protein